MRVHRQAGRNPGYIRRNDQELDPDKKITVYMTTRGQNRNLPIDLNLVYTVKFGDILEYEKGRISL